MSGLRFVQWSNEGRTIPAYGHGRQSRDFTYISDIATGTVASQKGAGQR